MRRTLIQYSRQQQRKKETPLLIAFLVNERTYLWAIDDPVPKANPCAMVEAMPESIPPPELFCWAAGGWAGARGAGGALFFFFFFFTWYTAQAQTGGTRKSKAETKSIFYQRSGVGKMHICRTKTFIGPEF